MARDPKDVDPRPRALRVSTVALVWAYGFAAGLYASLAATAKYGCMSDADGLACRNSGSMLGIALLVTVIAVVTLVTLVSANRPTRAVLVIAGIGVGALTACLVAACSVLSTA